MAYQVLLITRAALAYQAATAVMIPIHPPALVQFLTFLQRGKKGNGVTKKRDKEDEKELMIVADVREGHTREHQW